MTRAYHSRTKIVCTLGPATASRDAISALVEEGMNVARINFSHGTHEEQAASVAIVREVAATLGRPIAILGDLQGPRIRIGELDATMQLAEDATVVLAPDGQQRAGEIPVTYDALAKDVRATNRILIDDGLIELRVVSVQGARIVARVIHGGPVGSHKGINLPGVQVSAPSVTEKDRADIAFAVEQDLDYLALSFVRRADDMAALRALVPRWMWLIAKIEKDVALANIEEILQAADGVMVARGDLGVELPFEAVPTAQKRIIALANRTGHPVITATQMLESMVQHPRPTRAEASDVANAILDGTDAVMLSAETAVGAFPRLAVEAMARIIRELETHPLSGPRPDRRRQHDSTVSTEDAIAAATVAASRMLATPLVIVLTKSGFSARIVASHRPDVPILAVTDAERTYRQLALVWGVIPVLVPHCGTYAEMVECSVAAARRLQLAKPGDRVVVTAGVPFDVPGSTNSLKVERV
jgi:pyruvate kinase